LQLEIKAHAKKYTSNKDTYYIASFNCEIIKVSCIVEQPS